MDKQQTLRTIGYATGTVVLILILLMVAGVSTGVLPWRDSYMDAPDVTPIVDALEPAVTDAPHATPTPSPTPTAAPTPTPDEGMLAGPDTETVPTPVPTPDGTLDEELPTYTVTVTFSRGGTAIPYGSNEVVENGSMTVTAVPNEGFVVDEMIIDGERYKGITSYVFEDVNADHDVYISFKRSLFDPNEDHSQEAEPPIE